MALIYHELNIPLDTDSTFDYIAIKQGDAGSHKVRATLINNNSVFTIPTSNATYYFKFRKPDNTYVLVQATVSNNQIIADVTEEMLRVAGTGRGEFMIIQGSTELKTATFYFKIVPQTYTTDDVISSSDFATFASLLAGAGNAASNANAAAAAANTAAANAAAKADLIPDDYTALVQQVEDIQDELENLDVETDATLTEQGKPADAKATGDAIAELNGSLENLKYELPVLYLYGDTSEMTKDVRSKLRYRFEDDASGKQRTGWLDAKWQGNSSLNYPKKNYTFRFYHDSKYKRKDKVNFFEMTKQSKWVAKANYIDHSHARNIVASRIWADIVKSRVVCDITTELSESPNYGAINGYPIVIYLNDVYIGLYTLNIPKDDFTFGMDAENPLHCCAYGQMNNDGTTTPGQAALSNEFRNASVAGWECEVPGAYTEDTQAGLIALINFVMTSTDEEFYENLNTYLDVESAIDYYLFVYFIGATDSLAKNMILLTYDGGSKWYCSAYDLDTTFGLFYNGASLYPYNVACPEGYLDTNSLLWSRMEACFGNELYKRYKDLRSTVLSLPYIYNAFDEFVSQISENDYKADVEMWGKIPQKNLDHIEQIKTWMKNRASYVDAEIASLADSTPCEGINILSDEDVVVINTERTYMLYADTTPTNTTDVIVWTSSDTDVATVADGNVTFLTEGTVTITATCGSYSDTVTLTYSENQYAWTPTADYSLGYTGEIIEGGPGAKMYVTRNSIPSEKGVYKLSIINNGSFDGARITLYDNDGTYKDAVNISTSLTEFYFDTYDSAEFAKVGIKPTVQYPRYSAVKYAEISKTSRIWSYWRKYRFNELTGVITGGSQNYVTPDYIDVTSGADYVMRNVPGSAYTFNYLSVVEYDKDYNFIKVNKSGSANVLNVTMGSTTKYVRLMAYCSTAATATMDMNVDEKITFTKVN